MDRYRTTTTILGDVFHMPVVLLLDTINESLLLTAMHVLISGAGVAGPSLAWFLAKQNIRVTLFEKAASLLPHGQNVDIQGTARTVVDRMGLTEEFLRNGTKEKGTRLIDPRGNPIAPFPIREGAHNVSATSQYEILRADLAKLLWNATKGFENVAYKFDTTIKNIVSNDETSVKVETSHGTVEEYDLLVAADGQWSKVRKLCFGEGFLVDDDKGGRAAERKFKKQFNPEDKPVRVVDYNMRVAYWTIPRIPQDDDWWSIYTALPAKLLSIRPDPHGTMRVCVTCLPKGDAEKRKEWTTVARQDRQAQEALVRKEFSGTGWQSERLVREMATAPDFYLQPIQQIKMPRWYKNRVVCLGDAGYAPSPITGMGTSMAMNGAYILAGEISKLEKGEHPLRALEAYDKAYRPFVEEYQEVPPMFPELAHPRTAWQRWLFHRLLTLISRIMAIPWVVKRLGAQPQEDLKLPSYLAMERILHNMPKV